MSPLLSVRGLKAAYGASSALFGIDLDVQRGEVVVLLGRNGAGKTTTLKSIMGVHRHRTGVVEFKDARIESDESYEIARAGIGYVAEDCRIFRGLTVAENLETGIQPARDGRRTWDLDRVFELFPMLKEHLNRRGDLLSGGQQRMLAIARTLMGNPQLLLLDEPSEGLAPIVVGQLLVMLQTLKKSGETILLSEQNLKFSLQLADRAYIIEKGEIKYHGLPDQLAHNEKVRRAYLAV
jgi:branched-chain amino acid transport system ATP-binding protein